MSILKAPKLKQKPKATAAAKVQEKGDTITKTSPARGPVKPSTAVSKVGRVSGKDPGSQEKLDDAIENLKSSLARVEADKRENSYGYPNSMALLRLPRLIRTLVLSLLVA